MNPSGLLRQIASALEQAGIPFMLTGSVAAAWHGAGRATMDIDLVIDPSAPQLEALLGALQTLGLYVAGEAAREALVEQSMFNVIQVDTGWKVDLIICKSRPFSRSEFERRITATFEDTVLWIATPEDLIISKLEWAKLGNSSRQIEDVAGLLRIAALALDREYLEDWVERLGLREEWQRAQAAVG